MAYHFINLRAVVLLDISQNANVVVPHEVDGHTLQQGFVSSGTCSA
jgi:hypothetical protein